MLKGKDYIGVGVGAIIFNSEGKVFLSKKGRNAKNDVGLWEFPGGGVEFGNTLQNTLIEGIKRDFGIEVEILELLAVNNHILPETNQHWVAPSYICAITYGEPKIQDKDKCEEIGWFNLEVINNMPLSTITKMNIVDLNIKYNEKSSI